MDFIQVICSNLYISPYDELNKMSFVRFKDKKTLDFYYQNSGFLYVMFMILLGLAIYSSSTKK